VEAGQQGGARLHSVLMGNSLVGKRGLKLTLLFALVPMRPARESKRRPEQSWWLGLLGNKLGTEEKTRAEKTSGKEQGDFLANALPVFSSDTVLVNREPPASASIIRSANHRFYEFWIDPSTRRQPAKPL
jgi:hypothetical protein